MGAGMFSVTTCTSGAAGGSSATTGGGTPLKRAINKPIVKMDRSKSADLDFCDGRLLYIRACAG